MFETLKSVSRGTDPHVVSLLLQTARRYPLLQLLRRRLLLQQLLLLLQLVFFSSGGVPRHELSSLLEQLRALTGRLYRRPVYVRRLLERVLLLRIGRRRLLQVSLRLIALLVQKECFLRERSARAALLQLRGWLTCVAPLDVTHDRLHSVAVVDHVGHGRHLHRLADDVALA